MVATGSTAAERRERAKVLARAREQARIKAQRDSFLKAKAEWEKFIQLHGLAPTNPHPWPRLSTAAESSESPAKSSGPIVVGGGIGLGALVLLALKKIFAVFSGLLR